MECRIPVCLYLLVQQLTDFRSRKVLCAAELPDDPRGSDDSRGSEALLFYAPRKSSKLKNTLAFQFHPDTEAVFSHVTSQLMIEPRFSLFSEAMTVTFLANYSVSFCCDFIESRMSSRCFVDSHFPAICNALRVMLVTLLSYRFPRDFM